MIESEKLFEVLPDCPINDWSCPYHSRYGSCTCEKPELNCDDYMYYIEEEE